MQRLWNSNEFFHWKKEFKLPWPDMSPPTARCAPGEAPWEITESECIDFSVENTGGSPDEELRRKCNNLILLQHPHMHPFQPGHPAPHPDNCQVKKTQIKICYCLSTWWDTGQDAPPAAYTRAGLGPLCLNVITFRTQHFQAMLVLCYHMFYVFLRHSSPKHSLDTNL